METDGEAQAAYLLFRFHHVLPRAYFDAGPGERLVLRALVHKELEDRQKEAERARRG